MQFQFWSTICLFALPLLGALDWGAANKCTHATVKVISYIPSAGGSKAMAKGDRLKSGTSPTSTINGQLPGTLSSALTDDREDAPSCLPGRPAVPITVLGGKRNKIILI